MKSYTKIKEQLLKDKATHKAYQELGTEFALSAKILLRNGWQKGYTQAKLDK